VPPITHRATRFHPCVRAWEYIAFAWWTTRLVTNLQTPHNRNFRRLLFTPCIR